jgi:hypothetical protein
MIYPVILTPPLDLIIDKTRDVKKNTYKFESNVSQQNVNII